MPDETPRFIDISRYQPDPIDFAAVAATGCVAVVMKATQGANGRDEKFHDRVTPCMNAELLVGAYHYGTNADVDAQLDNFFAVVNEHPYCQLLRVLDFERRSNSDPSKMSLAQAEAFVQGVYDRTGVWPVLYFGEYLKSLAAQVGPESPIRYCTPWVAQYASRLSNFPTGLWPDGAVLWQYSGSGRIDGIVGAVDLDRALVSEGEFRALWG